MLPGCYLFDQPVNLLDRVFVAHMCQGVPAKVAEKMAYFSWWNSQYAADAAASRAAAAAAAGSSSGSIA